MFRKIEYVTLADGRFQAIERRTYQTALECFREEIEPVGLQDPERLQTFRRAERRYKKKNLK